MILTPPTADSDDDNGLLTTSEITGLKLDADWVILSACNTAAGDGLHAEALSGLTRAFIFAGTRSLLVSYWFVDSDASRILVERVFKWLAADATIGRSRALRLSIIDFLKRREKEAVHPAYWAPYILVGQ